MIQPLSSFATLRAPVRPARTQNTQPLHFGRTPVREMKEHYESLERDFTDIFEQSQKEPVSEENPAPDWIKKMERLSSDRKRWEKSIFDFMAEQPEHKRQLQHLQQEYNDYSLLQEKNPPKAPPALSATQNENDYSQATGTFSDFEARVSGMRPDSRAIFIGSGPQPNTVLTYAKHAGEVTGVDIDPNAVEKAKEVTAGHPLSSKMAFVYQDGQEVDYNPFTHVSIASMVPNEQKRAIMRRVSETANPGTMVTIRSTGGLKQAMYAPFTASEEDLKHFNQVATILGPDHVINRALVFTTKPKPGSTPAV